LIILFGLIFNKSLASVAIGELAEHYVFVTKWGSPGDGNGKFIDAAGIGADALGHIYVVDRGNDRIEKFDSTGKFITAWGSSGEGNGHLNQALDIAVYPCGNNLYVADRNNNRIQMFDSNGTFLREWGSIGTGNGKFEYPEGIAVDSRQGNVYVSDTYNNKSSVQTTINPFSKSFV
jgi:tripartite motif-containing protein 71